MTVKLNYEITIRFRKAIERCVVDHVEYTGEVIVDVNSMPLI